VSVSKPDYNYPLFHLNKKDRKEILLVEYDGFIKNKTEGLVQTMLKDTDTWIDKYPHLELLQNTDKDDLFEITTLFQPIHFMRWLSDNKLTDDEIESDILQIEPNIDLYEQSITMFEYSLFRILSDDIVSKCFILKDKKFYNNEIEYLRESYDESFSKITLVTGGLLSVFEKENPTTIFLNDTALLLGHIVVNYSDEQLKSKMFILRNTMENVEYSDDNIFHYKYNDVINKLNSRHVYGISRMFVFQTDGLESSDNGYEDNINEEE